MYQSKLQTPEVDQFLKGILMLEDLEEAYRFFEDICTVSELRSIAQRFDVAKMLREGMTYTSIAEKTGASTATISRVNRALQFGCDGYRLVFDKVDGQRRVLRGVDTLAERNRPDSGPVFLFMFSIGRVAR